MDAKEALVERQSKILENMNNLDSDSKEYADYCKDLIEVNKSIAVLDDHEIEIERLKLDLKRLDESKRQSESENQTRLMENDVKNQDSKRQFWLGIAKVFGTALVTISGYLVITHTEQTDVISSKLFSLIPKSKI